MSGFIAFLVIFAAVLILLKVAGAVFKVGFFLISIPIRIIIALLTAVLAVALFPIALVTGIFAVILAPFLFAAPFVLIGLGIYLLARNK